MKLYPEVRYDSALKDDVWSQLKQLTDARIALGRAGCSIPTAELLKFQLAHAQAKDAVLCQLDLKKLAKQLDQLAIENLSISSQASDKALYLKRPDLGKLLSDDSKQMLLSRAKSLQTEFDVLIVVGDGLSALAIEQNAVPFIQAMQQQILQNGWRLAPVVLASGSRVALADEVAEIIKAKMLIMLIGERPGLSSPDSMGIYFTWNAKSGVQDASRNCISNVRPAGLSITIAAQRLIGLMKKSLQLQISGVHLKDEHSLAVDSENKNRKRLF